MSTTFTTTLATHGGKQPSSPDINLAVNLACPTSYSTGGIAFDAGAILKSLGKYDQEPTVLAVLIEPAGGYTFVYDRTTKKIKAFWNGANGEAGTILQNMSLTSAGLAIGTASKAKIKIANTVTYLIAGEFKSKTTAEVAFTATTHDIPPDAVDIQEAVYLVTLQADGTPIITMGAIADGAGNAVIPAPPAGEAVIGYLRLAVAAGATLFDATTDELDEAHLTDTYVNLAFVPSQQLTDTPGALSEVAAATNLSALTAVRACILAI